MHASRGRWHRQSADGVHACAGAFNSGFRQHAPCCTVSGGTPVVTSAATSVTSLAEHAKQAFSKTRRALRGGRRTRAPRQRQVGAPPHRQAHTGALDSQARQNTLRSGRFLRVQSPQRAHGVQGGMRLGQSMSLVGSDLRRWHPKDVHPSRARRPQPRWHLRVLDPESTCATLSSAPASRSASFSGWVFSAPPHWAGSSTPAQGAGKWGAVPRACTEATAGARARAGARVRPVRCEGRV